MQQWRRTVRTRAPAQQRKTREWLREDIGRLQKELLITISTAAELFSTPASGDAVTSARPAPRGD